MNRPIGITQGGFEVVTGKVELKDGSVILFDKASMDEAIAFAEKWYTQAAHFQLVTVEEGQHDQLDQREGQTA